MSGPGLARPPAGGEGAGQLPLYTAAAVREADRRAIEERGIPGWTLMERAGRAAFQAAVVRYPAAGQGRVLVLAGRGNNGGDGFVFARHAARRGARVTVALLAPPGSLAGDAARARDEALAAGVEVVPLDEEALRGGALAPLLEAADLAVDALLGTGSRGAPRGPLALVVAELVAWRRRTGRPVVSLDLPSGLDPDRGVPANPCVEADLTVTFGALKVGLVAGPALAATGALVLAPIGIPGECFPEPAAWLLLPEGAASCLPPVAPDVHKGRRGRVWVVGGSRGMTGAAVLAARGALRAGAGLVHVAVPAGERPLAAVAVPEALSLGLPDAGDGTPGPDAWEALWEAVQGADALVVGPGLGRGPDARRLAQAVWAEAPLPAVVDADALFALAEWGAAVPRPAGPRVLTPHAGEAARLLGVTAEAVQADRLAAARELASRYRGVAVLKGARTVVAAPDGRAWINPTGSPALATGGSGDVLAGVIGALVGRGIDPLAAALVGAFAHGWAGQTLAARLGLTGVVAGDLPVAVARALEALRRLPGRGPGAGREMLARCGIHLG